MSCQPNTDPLYFFCALYIAPDRLDVCIFVQTIINRNLHFAINDWQVESDGLQPLTC